MGVKIYLAGSCGSTERTQMVSIAEFLRMEGYEVFCPFEIKIPNAWDMSQEEWSQKVFCKDIKAINDCDIMISISVGRVSTAGTNWEQGYAYALGKIVYVFQITNEPTSLMTYCGCTTFVNTSMEDICDDIIGVLYTDPLSLPICPPCSTVLT